MKLRLITGLALVGALFLSVSGAQAATPTMDGKKLKVINWTAKGGLQDNAATSEDREYCEKTCGKQAFVYKPAKGAKGGLMFTATWSKQVSDIDLIVAERGKNNTMTIVGACQGTGKTSEKVYLAPNQLKTGRTYVMIMYYFRSINETFTGKIEMGVPNSIKMTVPAKVDDNGVSPINCAL